MAEEFNIVAMAEELALLIADDLEVPVAAVNVLTGCHSLGSPIDRTKATLPSPITSGSNQTRSELREYTRVVGPDVW